jgi:hypothetical protein
VAVGGRRALNRPVLSSNATFASCTRAAVVENKWAGCEVRGCGVPDVRGRAKESDAISIMQSKSL